MIDTSPSDSEAGGTVRLAAVRRLGVSLRPTSDIVVQDGDLL